MLPFLAALTVAFGHGISVSPLHVVRGTAAIANNGIRVRPTLLAMEPGTTPPDAERVMQQATSDTMRRLMRLIVTDGFGKSAEVAGYFPGGKTGTAEKSGRGGYKKHANVTAFTSVFPMNAPRYAVYMMLDEPKANASTHGYATAGWVVAPAAGRVIARIGPMLGMLPDIANMPRINAELAIPLQPARPPSGVRTPPVAGTTRPTNAGPRIATPSATTPPRPAPVAPPIANAVPVPSGTQPARPAPGTASPPQAQQPREARPGDNRPNGPPVPALAPPGSAPATPPGAPGRAPARDLRHEARGAPDTPLLAARYVGSDLAAPHSPPR